MGTAESNAQNTGQGEAEGAQSFVTLLFLSGYGVHDCEEYNGLELVAFMNPHPQFKH